MKYPISTGQAARILDTTEPRLAEQVRRGKIQPEPKVRAGRRLWHREHLVQAANHFGISIDSLTARIEQEVA